LSNIDERLVHLFAQLMTDNENQRNAAAAGIYRFAVANHIHLGDLTILTGEFAETWRQTLDRLTRLDRETEFLRRHVSKAVLSKAAMAGEIEYQWPELVNLVQARFVDSEGRLVRRWRKAVAELCNVSESTLSLWEEGTAKVPYEVLDTIRRVPLVVQPKPSKEQKPRKPARPAFKWDDETLRCTVHAFLAGRAQDAIIEMIRERTGVTLDKNQLNQRLYNSALPEFMQVQVKTGGPIDWLEAWTIGALLIPKGGERRERGWQPVIRHELGLTKKVGPPMDINEATTQEKIDALRTKYHMKAEEVRLAKLHEANKRSSSLSPAALKVFNLLRTYGETGATNGELQAKLVGLSVHQRTLDLLRAGYIFSIGDRGNQTVWVAQEYKHRYPKEWNITQKADSRVPALAGPAGS
jgi:DNA-binding transcriptional regulator YiaG